MISLRYTPLPASFYSDRRDTLAARLPQGSLVLIHSNDLLPTNADGTMGFHQNANLFYLTGIDQAESVLLMRIGADGSHEDTLLLRETNEHIAIWEGAGLTQQEGQQLSGISDVRWHDCYQSLLAQWVPNATSVQLERDNHPRRLTYVQTRNARMEEALKASFPDVLCESLYPLLSELRLVKSPEELEQLRRACRSTGEGYMDVLPIIEDGMGEWEIEAYIEAAYKCRRSRKFSFTPIVASGANACVLHYISNHELCEDGNLILLDIGAEYGGYAGDMSRTIPANGRFTPRQRELYEACLATFNHAKQVMRAGVQKSEYERQVRVFMADQLLKAGLITQAEINEKPEDPPAVRRYFMHGTSHSLGIDVHDVTPAGDICFAPNQVWTIEPGIYVREEGIGIRIETDVVVLEEGLEDLLDFVPITPDEIEAAMNAQ